MTQRFRPSRGLGGFLLMESDPESTIQIIVSVPSRGMGGVLLGTRLSLQMLSKSFRPLSRVEWFPTLLKSEY